jgi:hypothetical protein
MAAPFGAVLDCLQQAAMLSIHCCTLPMQEGDTPAEGRVATTTVAKAPQPARGYNRIKVPESNESAAGRVRGGQPNAPRQQ